MCMDEKSYIFKINVYNTHLNSNREIKIIVIICNIHNDHCTYAY